MPILSDSAAQDNVLQSDFEEILLDHVRVLGCPDKFLDQIRGNYDFSAVRARIVTSQPQLKAVKDDDPIDPESYGQLRLRRVIQDLGFKNAKIELESCTGSIGGLDPIWLHRFFESFSGRRQDAKLTTVSRLPPVRIVYPTRSDVMGGLFCELSQGMDAKEAVVYIENQASNIGSHLRWKEASDNQKQLYYHFESKDPKKPLFHMKLLLAFPLGQSTARPLYVYIGSANLSPSAWGKALPILSRKKSDQAAKLAGDMRLAEVKNYECGVVIKGEDLQSMVAEGTWEEIVPYRRPVRPYRLQGLEKDKEKPWNSPSWVKPR
jgi:tyrosyl-DNA phosphodiesterase-1